LLATQDIDTARKQALGLELVQLVEKYPDQRFMTMHEPALQVIIDRPLARFGAWYELFPRSTSTQPGQHGTFHDCAAQLQYVADMGFDIVYLPPIHPIGVVRRKGPNNTLTAGPDDPGSPWAIGSDAGGHRDLHPQLGTLEDFKRLVDRAHVLGMEVAIDIAFQCAPDHPYIKAHPAWFRTRPDGTVQYAENPPKKYQDIYPFDFESDDWQALQQELIDVVLYWLAQGIKVFRVDNPHTKPFNLWERLIAAVKAHDPDVIFLSEAFTRPKVMHRLAKLGFTQSYTYFTWRNTQRELREYFTELSLGSARDYFRPNVWPNTPDILPEYLQIGGRPAFMTRALLAATLSAAYGMYGPAFELMEHEPREPGSEEYRDSEKYQLREWRLDHPNTLAPFIARLNRIRREHRALQRNRGLRFLDIDNDQMLAYARSAPGDAALLVVVANLDPYNPHSGWLNLPLHELGIDVDSTYRMNDVLNDTSYLWQGPRNFVRLEPQGTAAHIFVVQRHVRDEQDFDQFN
jgi:starch synthase (maltosyl-transferring)